MHIALHLPGPAFSRKERLPEQLTRRIKAAAARQQLTVITVERVKSVIENSGWWNHEMSPIVDDAIGMMLIPTGQGTYNPDAAIADIIQLDAPQYTHNVHPVARDLLKQARMVYTNYHSTSIHFVLPLLEPFQSIDGSSFQMFSTEFTAFEAIRTVLERAPYMGARADLPEVYHIKCYARLVYSAFLYHNNCLPTKEERDLFK